MEGIPRFWNSFDNQREYSQIICTFAVIKAFVLLEYLA